MDDSCSQKNTTFFRYESELPKCQKSITWLEYFVAHIIYIKMYRKLVLQDETFGVFSLFRWVVRLLLFNDLFVKPINTIFDFQDLRVKDTHMRTHTGQTAESVSASKLMGYVICLVWGQRLCQQIASSWFIYQGLMHRVKMRDSATNTDYNGGIINIDTN